MNIDIITVGNIKENYLTQAINEYLKRLRPYANVNIIEIGEYQLSNKASDKEIQQALEKEGQYILAKIKDNSYVISLAIEGKQVTSEALAQKIEDLTIDGYSDITFIIGGSYGMSNELKQKSDMKLSFSKMTFPHQLMRVILLEQVYRSFKILKNEPYHK